MVLNSITRNIAFLYFYLKLYTMKKLIFGLSLMVLSLTACSDDDNEMNDVTHAPIAEAILGKWYPAGYSVNGGTIIPYPGDDCDEFGDYQEFLSTGILNFVGYNADCVVDETNSDPYTINGNTLIVDGTSQFNIQSLTSQQLVLQRNVNTPEGMENTVTYFSRTRQ